MEALIMVLAFVCAASVLATWAFMKTKIGTAREEGYQKGFAEGVESQRRWNAHKEPEKRLIKVDIPNFGAPKLKVYSPIDYMAPLVCAFPSCNETLVAGDDFYEIPIINDPGSYAAVHLRCERKEQYGNPPDNSEDERRSREVLGGSLRRRPRRWLRKSVQGSDGRAQ